MRSKLIMALFILCVLLLVGKSPAQEHVFFWGEELGVGARAMALGGAYVGVADDYSAMYWNPSGLGQVRRMELNVGFNHNKVSNNATFLNTEMQGNSSVSRLNSLGFIFPVPTYRGSLVFGFGFNKVRDFDNVLEVEGFNPHYAAFADIVVPTYSGWSSAVNDSLLQQESILEEGSRNQYTLSAALEMQENFYVGVSMNLIRGRNDYGVHFVESDVRNLYSYFDESRKIMSDLDYWEYDRAIGSDFRATNFKLGILYHMGKSLRVGATMTTNTSYTVKENWSEDWKEYYDTAAEAATYNYKSDWTYKIREPFSLGVGASYRLSNIMLTAALDYKDWSQAKFLSDPPVASKSVAEMNRFIRHDLSAVTTLRFGAEFFIPVLQARVRGGYFSQPSPYKNVELRPKKDYYSAGLSFMLDKQVMMDLGYITGHWKQKSSDDLTFDTTLEEKTFSKLIGTLSIRF
jgi:long-subunit fatty acid transport protein